MEIDTQEDLRKTILALRKAKKLHTEVEKQLSCLISQISTEYIPIREPVGLAGGRNDLLLFEFSGKKVLFEIFASKGQVSRDLRIMDKTRADKKIAILIDREIDGKVFDAFMKENPEDNYPFIFISELYEEPPLNISFKLRQLIMGDEIAKFNRMLHARFESAKLDRMNLFKEWQKEGIYVYTKEDHLNENISFNQVFVTKILMKYIKMGISKANVKKVARWLSDDTLIKFLLMKLIIGFNVLLFTDFDETFTIYSDIEVSDWLRAGYRFNQAFTYLSLNAVMYEVDAARISVTNRFFPDDEKPSIYLGMSSVWMNEEGKTVDLFIPNNTTAINIILPNSNTKDTKEYIKMISIRDS